MSRPHCAAPITHSETGKSMEYRDLIADPSTHATWLRSAANESGRLAQGLSDNCVEPTNTIFFIPRSKVPKHKRPTYTCFVCSYHPPKAEPYRTRITVGGNLIDYPGNLSMKIADMTTFKILVNSTLSTPGARWLGLDVKTTILEHQWRITNTCSSPSPPSPTKSSHTTNFMTLSITAKSTWRYVTGCTVFPRLASWPKNK